MMDRATCVQRRNDGWVPLSQASARVLVCLGFAPRDNELLEGSKRLSEMCDQESEANHRQRSADDQGCQAGFLWGMHRDISQLKREARPQRLGGLLSPRDRLKGAIRQTLQRSWLSMVPRSDSLRANLVSETVSAMRLKNLFQSLQGTECEARHGGVARTVTGEFRARAYLTRRPVAILRILGGLWRLATAECGASARVVARVLQTEP